MKRQVHEFMSAIGTLPPNESLDLPTLIAGLKPLVPLLQEELHELNAAIESNDVIECVDAVIDLKYFLTQAVIWLEQAGCDVVRSGELVCENNRLKFTTSYDLAQQWLYSKGNILDFYIDGNRAEDGEYYYCIKDEVTHKVKKYSNFPSVDLTDCVPQYLRLFKDVHDNFLNTGDIFVDIKTKEDYNSLVATGMAWEFYNELPQSWDEFVSERSKFYEEK